jgi:hypothetical protein
MTTCWTCSVEAFRPAARRTTYRRSCGLGRVIPRSDQAEQRHDIIGNRLALVGEESVSGVTAELPPGQSGAPTHARLYHQQRRNHAVPRGADGQSMTARLPLHRTRSCTLPRSAASGCWRCGTLCPVSKSEESWRPQCADRSAVVGNRVVAGSGAAISLEAPLEAGRGDCDATTARGLELHFCLTDGLCLTDGRDR